MLPCWGTHTHIQQQQQQQFLNCEKKVISLSNTHDVHWDFFFVFSILPHHYLKTTTTITTKLVISWKQNSDFLYKSSSLVYPHDCPLWMATTTTTTTTATKNVNQKEIFIFYPFICLFGLIFYKSIFPFIYNTIQSCD